MKLLIDSIIRIKNGYLAKKDFVVIFYSRLIEAVVDILKREQYVKDYQIEENDKKKLIKVFLLYKEKKPVLTEVKIVSRPGRRIYVKVKDLKPVLGGLGMAVLSTPKGVMTDKQARKEKVGGELLFKVW